jgi:hypothetical protein
MYLSTLRGYVEAIGGELDLTVRFPSRPPVRLARLGEALGRPEPKERLRKRRSSRGKADASAQAKSRTRTKGTRARAIEPA